MTENHYLLTPKEQLIYKIFTMEKLAYEAWFDSLNDSQKLNVSKLLTVKECKYTPKHLLTDDGIKPFALTPKQKLVCLLENRSILMSGSGGGGKTVAMLYGALQYADHPKYSGLFLMRTLQNLETTIVLSQEWLGNTDAVYNQVKTTWAFPEGGKLRFSYLDKESDAYNYRSTEYNYIAFDELTQFKSQASFEFLFSRLRKREGVNIPLRVRAATNPGGPGAWVYDLFVNPETKDQRHIYVSMMYGENIYLNREEYEESLSYLTGVERARMQYGDWSASEGNSMIKKEWIKLVDNPVIGTNNRIRIWDMASTKPNKNNKDPDWSAGALCSYKDGVFTIENIVRLRGTPAEVESKILSVYEADNSRFGRDIDTYIELGGGAVKTAGDLLLRGPFAGTNIRIISTNVPKEERARPFAVSAENGYVNIVSGEWVKWLGSELDTFPNGNHHDDCVDAVVHAFLKLVVQPRRSKGSFKSFGMRNGGSSVVRPSGLYVPRR